MSSEQIFESDYFNHTYQGKYIQRNPPHKWKSFLKEITKHKPSGHLLDVGCALGLFLQQAINLYECDGCDISHYALSLAREKLPDKVRLIPNSIDHIEDQNLYDVITCFDVVEHIPELDGVWKNLNRLLKPNGIIVLTVPVYDGPLGWLVDRMDKDQSHVHRQERKFWLKEVEKNFSIISNIGIWRYFFFQRFYLCKLSRLTRSYTPAIMIIAKSNGENVNNR